MTDFFCDRPRTCDGYESGIGGGHYQCDWCKKIERLTTEVSELKEQLLGVGSAHLEAHIKRLEERYTGVMKTLDASVTETKKWQDRCESLANFNPDWDMLEATQQSLREHMANEKKLTAEGTQLKSALQQIAGMTAPENTLGDATLIASNAVSGSQGIEPDICYPGSHAFNSDDAKYCQCGEMRSGATPADSRPCPTCKDFAAIGGPGKIMKDGLFVDCPECSTDEKDHGHG